MVNQKKVIAKGNSKLRTDDKSFKASNISSSSARADIDPIISIDHFLITKPKFPPHPHAGFSAITYLFENSEGEFISRDSNNGYHVAKPGGVIWNIAGKGVIHEEYPKVNGETAHGLQMFINLPSDRKMSDPQVLFLDGPDVPLYLEDGLRVRVIAGNFKHVNARISPPGNITYLDIKLDGDRVFETEIPQGYSPLIYVIAGAIMVDGQEFHVTNTAVLSRHGNEVKIQALNEGAHIVLISGAPLDEPVVSQGPFVMNTEAQIQDAFLRYRRGEMGHLVSEVSYE